MHLPRANGTLPATGDADRGGLPARRWCPA